LRGSTAPSLGTVSATALSEIGRAPRAALDNCGIPCFSRRSGSIGALSASIRGDKALGERCPTRRRCGFRRHLGLADRALALQSLVDDDAVGGWPAWASGRSRPPAPIVGWVKVSQPNTNAWRRSDCVFGQSLTLDPTYTYTYTYAHCAASCPRSRVCAVCNCRCDTNGVWEIKSSEALASRKNNVRIAQAAFEKHDSLAPLAALDREFLGNTYENSGCLPLHLFHAHVRERWDELENEDRWKVPRLKLCRGAKRS